MATVTERLPVLAGRRRPATAPAPRRMPLALRVAGAGAGATGTVLRFAARLGARGLLTCGRGARRRPGVVGGAVAGAMSAYLLDPQQGGARRRRARERAVAGTQRVRGRVRELSEARAARAHAQ